MAKLINKSKGVVSARDDAFIYNAFSGGDGVFKYGNSVDYTIINNNLIRVKDGVIAIQGRMFVIYPDELINITVSNGAQGMKRKDLIVAEFSIKQAEENCAIKIIKGLESENNAVTPNLIQDNTLKNGTVFQLPLFQVNLDGLKIESVDDLRSYIPSLNEIYPIGAIYMSVNNVSPKTLFGGKWEQIKDRFLLGASSNYPVNSTGGEKEHQLSVNEMPSHEHRSSVGWGSGGYGSGFARTDGSNPKTLFIASGSSGGNQPHNNMPPYLAVYMWKRIA